MKFKIFFLVLCLLAIIVSNCSRDNILDQNEAANTESDVDASRSEETTDDALAGKSEGHEASADYVYNEADIIEILLLGNSIESISSKVEVSGTTATITSAGTYQLSGNLTDGQIIVDAGKSHLVQIIFNNAELTSSNSAPLFIKNCLKTILFVTDGTSNKLTDGSSYVFDNAGDNEPNATLFSKEDVTITGGGLLTVTGNYNDAIGCKDGLVITNANIVVNAADDGIRGKDYLIVRQSSIVVNSKDDGFKSDNDTDEGCGYIFIESGTFSITAGGDALQAESDLIIAGGSFTVLSGGGSSFGYNSGTSMKGLKAGEAIVIDDGHFDLNTADDAIHSNGTIAINNGTFLIASGDDGVHADAALGINGGEITITKSYEGLESAIITINDGFIDLVASDDGINVAGGNDGSGMQRPGGGGFGGGSTSSNCYLYINGGTIAVNASGDGLDANGSIEMTGGTVIVNGPTSNGDGALDYDQKFTISGGLLIAAGSSNMAQAPGTASSQPVISIAFSGTVSAGTLVHLATKEGAGVLTFAPLKNMQHLVISSPELAVGESYMLYKGGSYSGRYFRGLYTEGSYTQGTLYKEWTINSMVTNVR
ncbi:carbohydrate-binding domain-containing protein [Geofilum rhodophaeum]|uniref:carbohydrate-binding domain-containing protein n=1 Tax=Geofilum rhodophaeum TaxID=1965019 RepID=UPI000B5273C5|nr:carbohydrate-binding domain-containing protein [Geofilum rhodophaeum]